MLKPTLGIALTFSCIGLSGCSGSDTASGSSDEGTSQTAEEVSSGTICGSTIVMDGVPPGSQTDGFTWTLCVQSDGYGDFRAYVTVRDARGSRLPLPAQLDVELQDNGYPMAFSAKWVDPTTPFTLSTPWIYHPYSGNYCAALRNYGVYRGVLEWQRLFTVCHNF
jgi:hypothetical protein